MARVIHEPCDPSDEDYIDMYPSSTSFYSSPQSKDFEFHKSSVLHERASTSSPADELFYKGKLLPLLLPPRLQMVQTLLKNPNISLEQGFGSFDQTNHYFSAVTTPFESCNISPSDSRPVSRELNAEDYFSECGPDDRNLVINYSKQYSWCKKLKLLKQSSFGLKLKASRAYLKSLFTKSGCSDGSCADSAKHSESLCPPKVKSLSKYFVVAKRNPFGQIDRKHPMSTVEENEGHRRSFSSAIKWNLGAKSLHLPSSSSISSASLNRGAQTLKRNNSAHSEIENSIEEAIAHCKQSQQLFCAKKSASEHGFRSLSASRIGACDDA